jgi:hypothetical protein
MKKFIFPFLTFLSLSAMEHEAIVPTLPHTVRVTTHRDGDITLTLGEYKISLNTVKSDLEVVLNMQKNKTPDDTETERYDELRLKYRLGEASDISETYFDQIDKLEAVISGLLELVPQHKSLIK